MPMEIDTKHFKAKLEEELAVVEKELAQVGHINPTNPADWEPTPAKMDIDQADANERSDAVEEYETNTGVLKELEIRFNNIKLALKKIEDGTYGICEISGEPIEAERLEANPAARTNKAHMEEEGTLS